jgi:hypothetical protein
MSPVIHLQEIEEISVDDDLNFRVPECPRGIIVYKLDKFFAEKEFFEVIIGPVAQQAAFSKMKIADDDFDSSSH